MTGVPIAVGTFPVSLSVADAKGRASTVAFTWTVDYPPFSATNPGAQSSTLGVAKTVTLSVSGGSGSFAWTGGGTLPAGMTLSPAGVISGTATTAGARSVSLVATDSITGIQRTVAFTWTVFAKPTVTTPTARESTVGAAVSFQLTTTCPNAPCSYTLVNGPATLGISSTGLVTGTITSSAQTFSAVRVTRDRQRRRDGDHRQLRLGRLQHRPDGAAGGRVPTNGDAAGDHLLDRPGQRCRGRQLPGDVEHRGDLHHHRCALLCDRAA